LKRKTITRIVAAAALLILLAILPCSASDVAVLRNGFSIRHERRKVIGTITRLYVDGDNSSFVDVPTDQIDHFEQLPPDPTSAAAKRPASAREQPSAHRFEQALDLDELVNATSEIYKLDPDLVSSVIRAESGFNVRAVSPKGAQGLMQLMPSTASQLGVGNTFDARANVEGGTRYLRELLEHYNFDLIKALAAYNAGPQRVEQYGGVPPYYETKAYVARVVRDFNKKKIAAKNADHSTPVRNRAHSNAAHKSAAAGASEAKPRTSKPPAQSGKQSSGSQSATQIARQ
jgi:soluble lytic murein transglycosylase-like protein